MQLKQPLLVLIGQKLSSSPWLQVKPRQVSNEVAVAQHLNAYYRCESTEQGQKSELFFQKEGFPFMPGYHSKQRDNHKNLQKWMYLSNAYPTD